MAYTGCGRVSYRVFTAEQFPLYQRYNSKNVQSLYRYMKTINCVNVVAGLTVDQVYLFCSLWPFVLISVF